MSVPHAIHLDTGTGPRCGHRYPFGLTHTPEAVTCSCCLAIMAGGPTLGVRHPDWQLTPHGTLAAYRRHYRRGTQPCEACKQAKSRYNADRVRRTAA
jgi:hypothetical protein